MSVNKMTLDARLGLDKYEIDTDQSHITVDASACEGCGDKPCLTVCPAQVYQMVDERIAVRYENCLECGTCQLACDQHGNKGITWTNPQNGCGIMFRYG